MSAASENRELIIQQVAQGRRLADIAHDLGVSHPAISQVLAKDPAYVEARRSGLEAKLEQRETELECAGDGLTIARAKELLSHARWRAERLMPDLYGQTKQAVQVNTAGPATIQIVSWADTPSDIAT